MPSEFVPDKTLLNPKFEGYRLDPLESDAHVSSYPLPGDGATQSTISSRQYDAQPSFKEVRNRIRHNHLYPAAVGNQAGYIDKSGAFIIICYDFVGDIRPSVDQGMSLTTCLSTVIA